MYEFRIYNKSGEDVWVLPYQTITISEELNVGVTGNITINYLDLKRYADKLNTTPDNIISSEYREWKLYKDNVLFYAGILISRKMFGSKGQGTSLSIEFAGYEAILSNRLTGNAGTDWTYTSEDSADIAWDLIDQTQNDSDGEGDVGITRGTHPTTVDRDRTFRFDYIRKAIEGMSANSKDNGYDWDISNSKVFNIYYPAKGEIKSNIILDDQNILSWTNDKKLSGGLANRVVVIGEGSTDDIVSESVQDTIAQASWYLQEYALSEKDTSVSANLIAKGNKYLEDVKEPKTVISVRVNDKNPLITSYNVADTLPVKISTIDFDEELRIDRRTIQIQRTGEAQVDLSFDYD
jgi:hypothetical protein